MPLKDAPSTPRGYAKGRARRREILLVALKAFAEQGFRATSMREIADMVGLSQAGLLHHFSSKDELLEEVLRLRDEEQETFNERFGRQEGLNAVRYLIDLVELNSRQVGLVRLYTVLAGESVGAEHPARPYFLQRYTTVRERVASRLRDAQDRGEIRADVDLADVASVLIATMDGLQIQWLHDPETVDMKAVYADFLESYLRGLAPEPPR